MTRIDKLANNRPETAGNVVVRHLDQRISETIAAVQTTEVWKAVMEADAEPRMMRAVMREISLEIYMYQPQVIEATICVISRMPKTNPKMIKAMLLHQADEADHGEMALRDYVALGGNESYARRARRSYASFAVASVWWGLWHMEDPFCYLGALYPFEGLTPRVCQQALDVFKTKGFSANALEYITFHATEDVKHANLVRRLLLNAMEQYEGAAESIKYGLECFLNVYPIPVWMTAYQRAVESSR